MKEVRHVILVMIVLKILIVYDKKTCVMWSNVRKSEMTHWKTLYRSYCRVIAIKYSSLSRQLYPFTGEEQSGISSVCW